MSVTPPESEIDLTALATPRTLACGEVFGGNEPVHTAIELPGLHGVLYSHPCHGVRGGDVHYLSVCGSGLLARVCIADVLGHGEVVAQVSAQMHALCVAASMSSTSAAYSGRWTGGFRTSACVP